MTKDDNLGYLNIHSSLYHTRLSDKFRNRKPYEPADARIVSSFIPGTVLDIFIKEGEAVKKGDVLMILDAMKMKNRLICHMDGIVKSISVISGDRVSKGTVLMVLE